MDEMPHRANTLVMSSRWLAGQAGEAICDLNWEICSINVERGHQNSFEA